MSNIQHRFSSVYPGHRFGLLTVISQCEDVYVNPSNNQKIALYFCQCECGNASFVRESYLLSGHTKSCGCLRSSSVRKHGFSETRIYAVWASMKERCSNPNQKSYADYGERGIGVCERWQRFENFLADMGIPEPGSTLERIDNNLGYSPDNCKWATRQEQARNRRACIWLTFNGKTQLVSDWARELGLKPNSLSKRLKKWPLNKALSTPAMDQFRCKNE